MYKFNPITWVCSTVPGQAGIKLHPIKAGWDSLHPSTTDAVVSFGQKGTHSQVCVRRQTYPVLDGRHSGCGDTRECNAPWFRHTLGPCSHSSLAPTGAEFKYLGFARKAQTSEHCFGHTGTSSSDPNMPGIRDWRGLLIRHQNIENCNW